MFQGPWREERKLLLKHNASLPRKLRALADESWVSDKHLAHSHWGICNIHTQWGSELNLCAYFVIVNPPPPHTRSPMHRYPFKFDRTFWIEVICTPLSFSAISCSPMSLARCYHVQRCHTLPCHALHSHVRHCHILYCHAVCNQYFVLFKTRRY